MLSREFATQVRHEFDQLFANTKLEDEKFQACLVNAITHCFHIPGSKLPKQEKAQLVLNTLFSSFLSHTSPTTTFSLDQFIHNYLPKKQEAKRFLIALLYGLYFADIDLKKHQQQNHRIHLEFLMFQFLAETASSKTLHQVLKNLSFDKQITLIGYALFKYREGSFVILQAFQNSPDFKEHHALITQLKRNYFDIDFFQELLLTKNKITPETLKNFVKAMEERAAEETKVLHHGLNALISLIVNYPLRMLEENIRFRRELLPSYQPDPQEKKQALSLKENLEECFEWNLNPSLSLKALHQFTQLFGLRGQSPYILFCLGKTQQTSFPDKVQLLVDTFNDYEAIRKITQEDFFAFTAFALPIFLHIKAVSEDPTIYLEGLDQITFAIPTKGKSIEILPSLISIVAGLKSLFETINALTSKNVNFKDHPIFVYDQSDPTLFAKNQRFIKKLNRQNRCAIIQLSKEETVALSKKVGIEPLINTTGTGELGYAGARNSVYLLSPVLKAAFAQGSRSVKQVLAMEDKSLRLFFEQYVLGNESENAGTAILTVDDDMEIPEANIFAHVLFAQRCRQQYFVSYGLNFGRQTKFVPLIPSFKEILDFKSTRNLLSSTEWSGESISPSFMAECLTKPGVCINLPMGSEENQLKMITLHNALIQISYHLAGTRYPVKQLPTHFFVGLEEFLEKYIPYTLFSALASTYIDAVTFLGTSILPWSHASLHFERLQDAFDSMTGEYTKPDLQKKFWTKVHEVFFTKQPKGYGYLSNCIEDLINTDNEASVSQMFKEGNYLPQEKASLKKIAKLYSFYQQDAILYKEFALSILEEIKRSLKEKKIATEKWYEDCIDHSLDLNSIIENSKATLEKKHKVRFENTRLTYGFYLLARRLGLGDFCEIIDAAGKF